MPAMMLRATCAVLLMSVTLYGPARALAATYTTGQPIMGTLFEATIVADDPASARRLGDAAVMVARHWDDVLTTWRADGELRRFNGQAGSGWVDVSPDLAFALEAMLKLWRATGGAFDPSVAPLVEHWRHSHAPPTTPGSSSRLGDVLSIEGQRAKLAAGAALDAGGIGKGIALDHIGRLLRGETVSQRGPRIEPPAKATAAFINFGGSSHIAIGHPADQPRGWAIVVPGATEATVRGVIWLRDAALTTSRSSGAGYEGGPIIDPRTGQPLPAGRMATVIGASDGWSTALIVLGCPGLDRAREHGLQARIETPEGVCATPGFPLQSP